MNCFARMKPGMRGWILKSCELHGLMAKTVQPHSALRLAWQLKTSGKAGVGHAVFHQDASDAGPN